MLDGISARKIAILEARSLLNSDFIIVDTETTGLDIDAVAIEIAAINGDGAELINTLINPCVEIPAHVQEINKISNDLVRHAPSWADLHDGLMQIIAGRKIGIYNSEFDIRIIKQSALAAECWIPAFKNTQTVCVMSIYSKFVGEWDNKRGWWKRHKLTQAALDCGVSAQGAHRALADTRMTLGVLKHIAGQEL